LIAQIVTNNRPACMELNDSPDFEFSVIKESKGKVFVQGSFANRATGNLFARKGYEIVDNLHEADIVVWTGGEDINPKLYKENPAGASGWSTKRDADDLDALVRSMDKFKVGICRGAQLLNVTPNDGTLWQDVDHHVGEHYVTDKETGRVWRVNSLHHQQLRLTDKAELLAYTDIATTKHAFNAQWHVDEGPPDVDVEAAWYPETKSLLIQWHPEFDSGESAEYFHVLMNRYFQKKAS
jgi:gamma-glutamyl-gamma-aminobutyrate hydrolase PuuD